MNASVTVAQLEGSPPAAGSNPQGQRVLKVVKPASGEAVAIRVEPGVTLDLSDIAFDNITLVRLGERLVIVFPDKAAVALQPFFGADGKPLQDISLQLGPDKTLPGQEFAGVFPIGTDPSAIPATGAIARVVEVQSGFEFGSPVIDPLTPSGQRPNVAAGSLAAGASGDELPLPTPVATEGSRNVESRTSATTTADVNDAPVAVAVALGAVAEDGSVTITAAQLLAGVSDVDGPAATIASLVLTSGNGTLVQLDATTWRYSGALDDDSEARFAYTATDGALTASSVATLDLTPVNDAPVASAVALGAVAEDGSVTITAAQLLAGVSDVDGPAATIASLVLTSGNGTLAQLDATTWRYSGALDDDSQATFAYTATDGALTASSVATLDLTPVNDAPVASAVALGAVAEDGSVTITAAQLLAGVSDVDGPAATIASLVLTSGNGTLVQLDATTWRYSGALDDDSEARFAYTATDGALTASSVATLDLTPVNDAPVASAVALGAVAEDGSVTITAAQLLAGVSDVDGPAATIASLVLTSGNGTLAQLDATTWRYSGALDDDSQATFAYTATDGALTASSVATLDLTPVNDAPVASAVALGAVAEDGSVTITAAQLLAGVSDVDGPAATIASLVLTSGNGTLVQLDATTWRYSGALDDDSEARFAYTATDGALTASSVATLDLTPVNDAPVASAVALGAVAEDGSVTITAAQLLAGVSDVDGPAATIASLVLTSGNGTLAQLDATTWRYSGALDDDSEARFAYTATDGALTASSVATLDLTPVNDAPVLSGHENLVPVNEDSSGDPGTSVATMLAGHATDVDSASIGIAIVAIDASHGTWQFKSAGGAWTSFTLAAGEALHLVPTDLVRFVPAANVQTTSPTLFDVNGNPVAEANPSHISAPTIMFRAFDGVSSVPSGTIAAVSAVGGDTAYSATTETASIAVVGQLDRVFTATSDTVDLGAIANDPAADANWFEDGNYFDAGDGDDRVTLAGAGTPLSTLYAGKTLALGDGADMADASSSTIAITVVGGTGTDRLLASAATSNVTFDGGNSDLALDVLQVTGVVGALIDKTGASSGAGSFDVFANGAATANVSATHIERVEISGTGPSSVLTVLGDDMEVDPISPGDERIVVADQSGGFTIDFLDYLEQVSATDYGRLVIDGRQGDDTFDLTGLTSASGLNSGIGAVELRGGAGEDRFTFGSASAAATVIGGTEFGVLLFGGDTVEAVSVGDAEVVKIAGYAFDVNWNGSQHVHATEVDRVVISGTGLGSTLTVAGEDVEIDPLWPGDERLQLSDQSGGGFTIEFLDYLEQVSATNYGRLVVDGRQGDDTFDLTGLTSASGLNSGIGAVELRGGAGEDRFTFGPDSVAATVIGGTELGVLLFGGDTVEAVSVGDATVTKTGGFAFDVSWSGAQHVQATEIERVEIYGTGPGSTLTVEGELYVDPISPGDDRILVADQIGGGFTVDFIGNMEQVLATNYEHLVLDGRQGDDIFDVAGLTTASGLDNLSLVGGAGRDSFIFGTGNPAVAISDFTIGSGEVDTLDLSKFYEAGKDSADIILDDGITQVTLSDLLGGVGSNLAGTVSVTDISSGAGVSIAQLTVVGATAGDDIMRVVWNGSQTAYV
ncbi:cadherin-like domain-containing protein [Blastochloris viridis]|uniref:Alkaline phosphatase n=1 Tax=Blastochloris viridis TaxID=1079 RepID=A0A0H5BES4_BLAVI|nr:cadherin-like domain-containing protein [Blastochloris viridis]ALK10464.1 hypothetical protein BVIR_2699 [Blastochloris viridis]BAR99594.1 alkaline phosphatase [Blastochloris viridis]CUU43126.1 hypothetical protein BVIRIDIS_21430 [Blastochloris viridis]